MTLPQRGRLAMRPRSEIDIVAETAAAILNSGMIAKTPETIARLATLLRIPVREMRNAWHEISTHGVKEPRDIAADTSVKEVAPGASTAQVRSWAMENDIPVSPRGVIPRHIVERYVEAHA